MHGVHGADRDNVFVNVIRVHVVEMAVMKMVKMAVMANSLVPAVRAMLVGMVGMVSLGHLVMKFSPSPSSIQRFSKAYFATFKAETALPAGRKFRSPGSRAIWDRSRRDRWPGKFLQAPHRVVRRDVRLSNGSWTLVGGFLIPCLPPFVIASLCGY